jgi:hypothetical protein
LRACLAIVVLLLLGACFAFASPFDLVPQDDQAYGDCRALAESRVIDSRPASDFSGATALTRYDFTLTLVRPMAALETLATEGRPGPALNAVSGMTQSDRARVGVALARLIEEFNDVLSALGKDGSQALVGARLLAEGRYTPRAAPAPAEDAAGITYETDRARVGLVYRATEGEAAALPQVPLGGLTDAPITGLAGSRLPASRAEPDVATPARIASTDISLRRLRGSVEYGVTPDLTLNLAYEALVRQGQGMAALDQASLRTLGVGYRLSPSTSVKLNYHLINYADHTRVGSRLADRMAETELTVRF